MQRLENKQRNEVHICLQRYSLFWKTKCKLGVRQADVFGSSEGGTGRSSLTCIKQELQAEDLTVPSCLNLHPSIKHSPFHFNSFLVS